MPLVIANANYEIFFHAVDDNKGPCIASRCHTTDTYSRGANLSSDTEASLHHEARLEAHEHLLRQLIVTVLARSEDPLDALEGFQRRLTAPLRRRPVADAGGPADSDLTNMQILEIVDWISKGVAEDIQHAQSQVTPRRR